MSVDGGGAGPALVVLAAGASARLGESKALAEIAPGPGGRAIELLLAAGAALGDPRPLVVAGPDHDALAEGLPAGVELLHHAAWSAGRTGSVRAAAARRPGRDLCLAPVDAPLVPAAVFAALAAEWRARGAPGHGWLGPFVEREGARRFGHPIVVGRALLDDLNSFPPAAPLARLRAAARPLLALEVSDTAILDDLDTPADLARLRARHGGR